MLTFPQEKESEHRDSDWDQYKEGKNENKKLPPQYKRKTLNAAENHEFNTFDSEGAGIQAPEDKNGAERTDLRDIEHNPRDLLTLTQNEEEEQKETEENKTSPGLNTSNSSKKEALFSTMKQFSYSPITSGNSGNSGKPSAFLEYGIIHREKGSMNELTKEKKANRESDEKLRGLLQSQEKAGRREERRHDNDDEEIEDKSDTVREHKSEFSRIHLINERIISQETDLKNAFARIQELEIKHQNEKDQLMREYENKIEKDRTVSLIYYVFGFNFNRKQGKDSHAFLREG